MALLQGQPTPLANLRELVELYRTAAVALDVYFCKDDKGRDKKDPVYQYVVEKRDVPSTYEHYSSCGDRAHARYWRLGCRLPFVNREERTPAPNEWKAGWNISLLHDVSRGSPVQTSTGMNKQRYACPPGASWRPAPATEMLIWNSPTGGDAHSLSILDFDGKKARTANYGAAGMSASSFPGAKISEAPLTWDGKFWRYGVPGHTRIVQRVTLIEDMVPTFSLLPDLTYVDGDVLPAMSEVYDKIVALRAA